MLELGLVGIGPLWDQVYQPALQRQCGRLAIRAAYVPVVGRAAQQLGDWNVCWTDSLGQLVSAATIRAVLVLDSAWFQAVPAEWACDRGKPVLLADSLGSDPKPLWKLAERARDLGIPLIPDLLHRYTPATSRLRELLVTRLGRIREIELWYRVGDQPEAIPVASRFLDDPLATGLDWCHLVLGTQPEQWGLVREAGQSRLQIGFSPPADRSTAARVTLCGAWAPPAAGQPAGRIERAVLRCQHGSAEVTAPDRIRWQHAEEEREECLAGERTACDVMIDHFARRVVGGLIPLATLEDALRSLAWGVIARNKGAEGVTPSAVGG
ncbi:MAG: hypothetical protein ACKOFW_14195 [Planctomycetaceae bacterium]